MTSGEEFVYPMDRAMELAKSTNTPVLFKPVTLPMEVTESSKLAAEPVIAELKRVPIMAVQPTGEEVHLAQVVTPPAATEAAAAAAEPVVAAAAVEVPANVDALVAEQQATDAVVAAAVEQPMPAKMLPATVGLLPLIVEPLAWRLDAPRLRPGTHYP